MYVVITHATTLQMRVVHFTLVLTRCTSLLTTCNLKPLMNFPILIGMDFLRPLWCFA